MANNRMWLVHKPTGRRVLLGKRLDGDWYIGNLDLSEEMEKFLGDIYDDQFCLAMETTAEGAPPEVLPISQFTSPASNADADK